MIEFPYTKLNDISPIPALSIYLQNPKIPALSTVFDCAILDTGSDLTVISYGIVSRLQLRPIDSEKSVVFRGLGQKSEGIPFRIRISFDRDSYITT